MLKMQCKQQSKNFCENSDIMCDSRQLEVDFLTKKRVSII